MNNEILCQSKDPDKRGRYWQIIRRDDGSIFVDCRYAGELPQIVFDSRIIEPAEIKQFLEVTG